MKKETSRRKFISNAALGAAAAGLMVTSCKITEESMGDKFIHHVFFWLKQPVTQEIREKFENALKELATIETIVDYHIGVPAPTSRDVIDTSYTYSMFSTYKSKEDQDVYQGHEKHLKFIADCQDLWERVVVYDSVALGSD